MSGRLLSFANYLGQANNVQIVESFPSNSPTYTYTFPEDITNYTFELDAQTIVVDQLSYDRTTGDPNFTDSLVIGSFANTDVGAGNVTARDNAAGTVNITIPPFLYTGPILPDARANVPITVFRVKWTDTGSTPNVVDQHRWGIIQRYTPGDSTLGSPRLDANFIPVGTGAITTFTSDAGTDASRTAGTYKNVTGLSGGNSEGTGATFQIVVDGSGVTTVDITNRGQDYIASDTIEILDSSIGGGGAADITVTVSSVS